MKKDCDQDCGDEWSLTEAEIELKWIAANTDDTSDRWLGFVSGYAECTVRSMFGHMEQKMGVRQRGVVVTEAIRVGLVKQSHDLFERYKRGGDRQRERESH